jgi:hypothetical protein
MSVPLPEEEYKHASENIRHFQSARFSLLTVFIAISAGLLSVLAATSSTSPGYLGLAIKAIGLLTTLLFGILMERTMLFWRHFVRRAIQLEETLDYQLYRTSPHGRLFTGTNAMRGFFVILGIFWLASMIWLP